MNVDVKMGNFYFYLWNNSFIFLHYIVIMVQDDPSLRLV